MCGINGIISKNKSAELNKEINLMNDKIVHRGPDEEGVYVNDDRVAFAMRRLSIIDLSSGKQPISTDDDNLTIVFNGEIYNYRELKQELIEQGVAFKTESDTEVILKLYELYGPAVLPKLNGMFAFSIHDKKNNIVFIARDRFGEKPLYYCNREDQLIFASELKSITRGLKGKPKISLDGLNLYLSLSFIPAPFTIYQDIFKLPAAHYMVVNCNTLNIEQTCYWQPETAENNKKLSYTEAKKQVKEKLYNSVKYRMIADVPLGVFLSGGVDSSIVTAIMADLSPNEKIKTFSIGFTDKNFDESERALAVAKHCNTEHYTIMLDAEDLKNDLERIILNYDEPFADSSALPTYYVAKHASKKVKVVLTGDGGDETFGGYNRYLIGKIAKRYHSIIPNSLHHSLLKPIINFLAKQNTDNRRSVSYKIKRLFNSLGNNEKEGFYNIILLGFYDNERALLLKKEFFNNSVAVFFDKIYTSISRLTALKKSRLIDKNISLEGDMLVKVDRASMLTSLECRAPFLDHNLFDFTTTLPDEYLLKGFNKKRILKDTFKDLLPENLFNLPKSGFGVPVGNWLRLSLKEQLLMLTQKGFIEDQGLFNANYLSKMVDEHLSEKVDHTFKIWTIFCFQLWYTKTYQTK